MSDLHELFSELEPHELENMPRLSHFSENEVRDTWTPKPDAYNDDEDTPMSEVASPPPQPDVATQPKKKPKTKGRSGGEKSSRPVKQMRKDAGKGDIEAAMKLGWGVDRITDIFNKNKAKRGEKVTPGQPIDDLDLLQRITERHEYQAKIQKKRQDKLRVLAEAGDYEAAKKLKMGKKRLRQLFPHLFEEVRQEQDHEKSRGVYPASTLSGPSEREKTPAEPFDFMREREEMAAYPRVNPYAEMMSYNGRSAGHTMPGICGETYLGWSPALDSGYSQTPPRYPITPMAMFDPRRALRREYEAAVQQVAVAQANLARVSHELEQSEQMAKMRAAHPCVSVSRGQKIKNEDGSKNVLWNKKTKKTRPSNFPEDEPTEETPEAMMQTPAPASIPVRALLQY